jgi:hypothetical protein
MEIPNLSYKDDLAHLYNVQIRHQHALKPQKSQKVTKLFCQVEPVNLTLIR